MTRTTGPDCAVMCNLINIHTHTHRHNLESTAMKRAMVKLRGAREKDAMAFVECLGVS